MRLLLADDSPTSRILLQRAVEELGHDVITADDGEEAWRKFQDDPTEVVISDWLMPGMDGDELCRRIREDESAPYTYFIMLTSLEDKEYVLQGMEAGADDYLAKPLDRQDLAMRLIAASRVTALHRQLLRQQQEIQGEVDKAAGIQMGLLPDAPPTMESAVIAGRCVPAAKVGGDYYDTILDEEGRAVLLIADVAGHSIGSALLMAMARSILRREVGDGDSPGAVLRATNTGMYRDLANAGLFITMFCGRFDPRDHSFTWSDAGHNPPMIRRASGEVEKLEGDAAPVGILPEEEFTDFRVQLEPGDQVLLYTDGVVEAADSSDEQFGEDRLEQLVAEAGEDSPEELCDRVLTAIGTHSGELLQGDDVTVLAMRVTK